MGASRTKLLRLGHMAPGTRVAATERVPSGPCHAVEGLDATAGLCGADVIEVLEQSFGADTELAKCAECEKLVESGASSAPPS